MSVSTVTFQQALTDTADAKRQLLLGNGFSIALFPNRFHYGSLFDAANFSGIEAARQAFSALNTTDFEMVIQVLLNAAAILPFYDPSGVIHQTMLSHAEALKTQLVQAISGRHPERPIEITEAQYRSCREFLSHFIGSDRDLRGDGGSNLCGYLYTLNYDLILYWTLLHIDADMDSESEDYIKSDDGFRAPDDEPDAAFVTWDAEGAADGQNIHYLHGALHLFENGPEIEKLCWRRAGETPLITQIRSALASNKFPLFVSEGSTDAKLTRIRNRGYLLRSLKSFAQVCKTKSSSLFIFGHSLAPNDNHILRYIEKGKIGKLYISLFGDPNNESNKRTVNAALDLASRRPANAPLEVKFFDAASAHIWDAPEYQN